MSNASTAKYFWDFRRGPASARLLVDCGTERGITARALLEGTALSRKQLDDPHVTLDAEQELRVARNLLRLLKHPPWLGLEIGSRYQFSAYGMWGYGLISSATMRAAIGLALRFLPLTYAFTAISFREERGLGILSFGEPNLSDEVKDFLIQRDMSAATLLLREIGGADFSLCRFALARSSKTSAIKSTPLHHSVFGMPLPCFGSANELAFDAAFLDRALPQANPVTVAMCEDMCAKLMEERRVRLGTATTVRHFLDAARGESLALEDVARLTYTSARTLKRRLQEEGTTFRALLEQSRKAQAETLLAGGEWDVSEIAERLGFGSLSSFSQAFKRWHGVAPSNWQRRAAKRYADR